MPSPATTHDVVVIGSRCAGAATAMLLARAGHDVVLVDRITHPRDTVSTHGLARGAVVQLARWGLLDPVLATGAPPVRRVTFGMDGSEIVRPVKTRAGIAHLLAPRRYALDALITDEARRAGALVVEGEQAVGLQRDDTGRVTGVTLQDRRGRNRDVGARFVVGADGLRSTIAELVRAPITQSFTSEASLFYVYVESPAWEGFEFHLAPSSFAGVFPTHDGQGCVWLCRPQALL